MRCSSGLKIADQLHPDRKRSVDQDIFTTILPECESDSMRAFAAGRSLKSQTLSLSGFSFPEATRGRKAFVKPRTVSARGRPVRSLLETANSLRRLECSAPV